MSRAVEGTVAWLRSLSPDERMLQIEVLRQVYPAKFLYEVVARARVDCTITRGKHDRTGQ